jgi:type VI secretion system secreted protein Hcp
VASSPSALPSRGADVYLSIKTKRAGAVKGEATASGHANEIELDGFHFGVRASSAIGSGAATARRQYDLLRIEKRLDTGTTALLSALVTNDEVKEAKLALRKAAGGQEDFFTITLSGARVVSAAIDCDIHGAAVETVELAFTKVDIEYRLQKATGIAGATHNFNDEILVAV